MSPRTTNKTKNLQHSSKDRVRGVYEKYQTIKEGYRGGGASSAASSTKAVVTPSNVPEDPGMTAHRLEVLYSMKEKRLGAHEKRGS